MSSALALPSGGTERVRRVKRLFASKAEVDKRLLQYSKSKWGQTGCVPRRNLPQITRVTRGLAQAGFLMLVRDFTDGAPRDPNGGRPPEFSPSLTPEDACHLLQSFTRQHMLEEMRDAVNRGLVATKAGRKWGEAERLTQEDYQFRCSEEDWSAIADPKVERKKAARAADAEGVATIDEEEQTAGEEEANSDDSEGTCGKSRETVLSRVLVSPAKTYQSIGRLSTGRQVFCRNRNAHPISVKASVSGDGDIRVDLLPPPGKVLEMPRAVEVSGETEPFVDAKATSAKSREGRVSRDGLVSAPKNGRQDAALHPLLAGLVQRGYHLIEPTSTEWVQKLATVPEEFVWAKLDERTRNGEKRVSERVLVRNVAGDIVEKYALERAAGGNGHSRPAKSSTGHERVSQESEVRQEAERLKDAFRRQKEASRVR